MQIVRAVTLPLCLRAVFDGLLTDGILEQLYTENGMTFVVPFFFVY